MNELEQFQIEGIDFMLEKVHAFNADDMGMGKTVQTIGCANRIKAESMIIVCPASVKYYWKSMIKKWADKNYSVQVLEGEKAIMRYEADVIILNYSLVIVPEILHQIKQRNFTIGVCDEAHHLQSLESQRSKAILGKNGFIKHCKYKFMLSGTPISSRPKNLYPILKVLATKAIEPYTTFEKFAYKFCGAYIDKWSGALKTDGASNYNELKGRLSEFMIRRVDTTNNLRATYDIVPLHIPDYVETGNDVSTIRQECAIEKIKHTDDYVGDMVQSVDKLVIFFYHRSVGKALMELLAKRKFGTAYIDGSVSPKEKQARVDRFISLNDCSVLLGQFQACGEGVDGLQHVCNHALFYEASWIPRDIQQAVARLKRRGQKKVVRVQILAVEDSIEYSVIGSMIKKRKLIKKIID